MKAIQHATIDELRRFVDWCNWQPEYVNEQKRAGERWRDYQLELLEEGE